MLNELRAWLTLCLSVLTMLAGLVGYVAYLLAAVWRELHALHAELVRHEERLSLLTDRVNGVEHTCKTAHFHP